MKKLSLSEKSLSIIRNKWLQIFVDNGYLLIESLSLIPNDDHSLLWVNSGVAALKKYFSNPLLAPARNLVNCQRVVRTNDIDRINSNSYHQTLFEMLGCFSIGGDFKAKVIPLVWKFFTASEYLAMDPQCLFITVLENDHETYQIWKEQPGFFEENIILGSRKTNFWDMGDGPCGPNSEIYYSFRKRENSLPVKIEELDDRSFIEIINIVFSEFYHRQEKYLPLQEKCVDVGAGLERIALVLQGVTNTFETDIWISSVNWLKECCARKGNFVTNEQWKIYVIADHLRTFIFATADGALSGHKRRGYVLKKLIKKSSLFAYMLGIEIGELLLACEKIVASNSSFYPFLLLKKDYILEYLKQEIMKFLQGFEVFNVSIRKYLETFSDEKVPAEKIFFWYDTEGMPLELIKSLLLKKGRTFDQGVFNNFLSKQKERSFSRRIKVDIFNT